MLFSRQNKIAVIAAVGLMKQSTNVNGLKPTQDERPRISENVNEQSNLQVSETVRVSSESDEGVPSDDEKQSPKPLESDEGVPSEDEKQSPEVEEDLEADIDESQISKLGESIKLEADIDESQMSKLGESIKTQLTTIQNWLTPTYEKFKYSGLFFFQMIIASIIMISVLDRDNCLFQISTIVLLISLLCLVITIIGSLQTYSGTKSNKTSSSE